MSFSKHSVRVIAVQIRWSTRSFIFMKVTFRRSCYITSLFVIYPLTSQLSCWRCWSISFQCVEFPISRLKSVRTEQRQQLLLLLNSRRWLNCQPSANLTWLFAIKSVYGSIATTITLSVSLVREKKGSRSNSRPTALHGVYAHVERISTSYQTCHK